MAALAQRKARLEELEKENAELREQVERLSAPAPRPPAKKTTAPAVQDEK